MNLKKQERANGGVLDAEVNIPSTIVSHGPGYLKVDLEKIVGVQTEVPLVRAFMPFGGIRMAEDALKSYGFETDAVEHKILVEYRVTQVQGVFDASVPEMRKARH